MERLRGDLDRLRHPGRLNGLRSAASQGKCEAGAGAEVVADNTAFSQQVRALAETLSANGWTRALFLPDGKRSFAICRRCGAATSAVSDPFSARYCGKCKLIYQQVNGNCRLGWKRGDFVETKELYEIVEQKMPAVARLLKI